MLFSIILMNGIQLSVILLSIHMMSVILVNGMAPSMCGQPPNATKMSKNALEEK